MAPVAVHDPDRGCAPGKRDLAPVRGPRRFSLGIRYGVSGQPSYRARAWLKRPDAVARCNDDQADVGRPSADFGLVVARRRQPSVTGAIGVRDVHGETGAVGRPATENDLPARA